MRDVHFYVRSNGWRDYLTIDIPHEPHRREIFFSQIRSGFGIALLIRSGEMAFTEVEVYPMGKLPGLLIVVNYLHKSRALSYG